MKLKFSTNSLSTNQLHSLIALLIEEVERRKADTEEEQHALDCPENPANKAKGQVN